MVMVVHYEIEKIMRCTLSLLKYIFLLLAFASQLARATECDVYTTPRNLKLSENKVAHQMLDREGGDYVVIFENGDILLASFNQCGLGLHAHYYAREPLIMSERTERLKWMLFAVLPSREAFERLKSQLTKWSDPANDQVMSVYDGSETHDFTFRASESPLFKTSLHYTWNPPEY